MAQLSLIRRRKLSLDEIEGLKMVRHKARTDLHFLATDILGFTDIDRKVHGPLIRRLEIIMKGCQGTDIITQKNEYLYIPKEENFSVAIAQNILRRYLILAFRSSFKTTINTIAHT